MTLILSVFWLIVGSYFFYNKGNPEKNDYLAILFCGAYVVIFLFLPQFSEGLSTSVYLGKGYGLFPVLPLIAILFPHFNSNLAEETTRALGWIGLIVLSSLLLFFKFFVWNK